MVVYDVHSEKMGNTTMSTMGIWNVRIVSVDADTRSCMASWNGNPAKRFYAHNIKKWREKKPLLIDTGLGCRLATSEEIQAAKAVKSA